MTIKTFVTLMSMLFYFSDAHSQTEDLPPSRYPIDSIEWLKLCQPTYRNDYYRYVLKTPKIFPTY
ncbi:MAG: hypothetical protein RLZZ292_3775 [Bacteroidota bacterium]|jgi:hypothetical protein